MLVIRTGKPGHGKTLNTIREVDQIAHAQGRVVYFHNINGLKPDQLQAQWFEFEDPEKWFDLPSDAVIVVDEAQGWFGARDPRARPPEHITRFETMRHQGHEVHLVTQDPRYLDVHLRRLCNSHIHYWRVFKSAQLLRFESEVVVEKVEVKSSFKDADKKSLRLDKRYFGAYTSTNAKHHFQTKVPTKFLLALCVLIGAAILVYRAYERYNMEKTEVVADGAAPAGSMVDQVRDTVGAFIRPSASDAQSSAPETTATYIGRRVPRIPQIPASAPIYDELTRPVSFPRLYCMSSSDPDTYSREFGRMAHAVVNGVPTVCQCYTQQSTRIETDFAFCHRVVENGFFDPTIPDRSSSVGQRQDGQVAPRPALPASRPVVSQPVVSQPAAAPGLTVVPYQKGQFLW